MKQRILQVIAVATLETVAPFVSAQTGTVPPGESTSNSVGDDAQRKAGSRPVSGAHKSDLGDKSRPVGGAQGGVLPTSPASMSGSPPPRLAPTTGAAARHNCGTFWTAPVDDPEADVDPCPKDCVRGERQLVRTHKRGRKTLYEARYHCYRVAAQVSGPVAGRAPGAIREASALAATLSPSSGPWHTFVQITGTNVGSATGVRVVWYPDDDDSRPQAGAMTATLRKRLGADHIEIEIPRDAGGSAGGVVRVLLQATGAKDPVLAGRFTVVRALAAAPMQRAASARSVAVPLMTLTGRGPAAAVTVSEMSLAGAGPTSVVAASAMTLAGAGPTASVTLPAMTVIGAGPPPSVSVPTMALTGWEPLRKDVAPR